MLYEILKTSKLGASFAPDMYTALWAQKLARDGEVKTLSGAPPLSFQANGTPLLDYLISGNTVQSGTPTPDNPITPQGTGDLETSGTKAGQYKIPISSANTTTPVYLGEVETTRRVKKLVLTGAENFTTENNIFAMPFTGIVSGYYQSFCNAYSHQSSYAGVVNTNNTFAISNTRLLMHDSRYTSADDFKSYLAQQYLNGTPVTVWYALATPTTGIVNEPLMKIGEYADTVSYEQAGVEIPTARGTNTLDVLTDVKPSNVYLKYKEA